MSELDQTSHLVVLTTLGSVEEARTYIRELVTRRVVACGTILPGATSIYRWKGTVAETTEVVVLLKTRRERWGDLLQATGSMHPYQVPELLGLPVVNGLERYLEWVTSETIERGNQDSE